MKRLFIILTLCLACFWGHAQINVSTGINSSGAALPHGSTDPNWNIVSSPYPPGAYAPFVVPSYLPYWQVTPITGTNAQWLNKSAQISNELPGIYTFERNFSVPSSAVNFTYSLSVAYDDEFVSLELVSPSSAVTPLTIVPSATWYHLSSPATGAIGAPLTGAWTIRAKVKYVDQLGAFMLSGNISIATDSSVYCCTGANLVKNGNFEAGNSAFASQYGFQPSVAANGVLPGQYNVVNHAQSLNISSLWNVEDHTKCINGANSRFMVVNGRTTQPAATTRVIWQQVVPVVIGREYKLCANFKNMPQCTFDIKPQVRLEINGVFGPWTTINTATNMCSWQLLYQCFVAGVESATIRIHLKEDGLGDGNDLAIDDIALQEKLSQDLAITVQHQAKPKKVTGSLNTIVPADDQLLNGECEFRDRYYWFIFETSSYPALNIVPNTFAWSSNSGGWNTQLPGSAIIPGWGLTTTFPGYAFDNNKLYVVGLYVPSCCESCYSAGFTYQLTANFSLKEMQKSIKPEMTDAQKEQIKAMFIKGRPVQPAVVRSSSVLLYPNPANDQVNIKTDKEIKLLQVLSADGTLKIEEKGNRLTRFDITGLTAGVYTVKILFANGESATEKFVKE